MVENVLPSAVEEISIPAALEDVPSATAEEMSTPAASAPSAIIEGELATITTSLVSNIGVEFSDQRKLVLLDKHNDVCLDNDLGLGNCVIIHHEIDASVKELEKEIKNKGAIRKYLGKKLRPKSQARSAQNSSSNATWFSAPGINFRLMFFIILFYLAQTVGTSTFTQQSALGTLYDCTTKRQEHMYAPAQTNSCKEMYRNIGVEFTARILRYESEVSPKRIARCKAKYIELKCQEGFLEPKRKNDK